MSILLNTKLRTILTSINSEAANLENKRESAEDIQILNDEFEKVDRNANGFTIYAGRVTPKVYSGPSAQEEVSSEPSKEHLSNEAKELSKIIKGGLVSDVEAPDFFKGVDSLMKKVDEVVGDPNTPDTPMAEAFRNANKNRNRNRNRGHGRGHHD